MESSMIENEVQPARKWKRDIVRGDHQRIVRIYTKIFHCTKIFGILPFEFNADTLKLTPIYSGRSYYFFWFNFLYVFTTMSKVWYLLFLNWWTNFEQEEIRGGYFMQFCFVSGYSLLYSMLYSYCFHKDRFANAISSCIQMEANLLQDFPAQSTLALFNWRCTYLNLQFTAYCGITFAGMFVFFAMAYYVPALPQFLNSIIRTQNMALELSMALTEAYIFPVAFGIISTGNILVCITFGSLTGGIRSLSAVIKAESENAKYLAANRAYACYQVIIDRLTSVFSVSFLFQELSFLLLIVTLVVGGVKMSELKSISLEIFCFGTALEITFVVTFQFFPMIMLYLYSKETTQLMRAFMTKDRHARAMARRSRLLKVRPMGVHTITLETLFDYAVFIVSLLLMLLKA